MATEDDDDAPEEIAGEGVDLPKKKVSGKKLLLLLVLILLLLGGGGAGVYFSGILDSTPSEEDGTEKASSEENAETEELGSPVFYEMPQILINLRSSGRRPSFLRLKVSIQLRKEEDKAAVEVAVPRIIDSFQFYLRELSREELQGSAGLERLREELFLRVGAAVAPVEIKDILFTEMVFGE